ncbi:hypothetical protein EYF80_054258 [Liparis tanakae]|uniref:Uncharacterized protein n=1 Tax=Liparis tanakae TaxID=230148 RepID=A0A4Z2F365_9TELE|nr:hypothetical protein EYF80_054258 [Liparis tanakae]
MVSPKERSYHSDRDQQRGPERSKEVQRGPGRSREVQRGPERSREVQGVLHVLLRSAASGHPSTTQSEPLQGPPSGTRTHVDHLLVVQDEQVSRCRLLVTGS